MFWMFLSFMLTNPGSTSYMLTNLTSVPCREAERQG